MNKTATIYIAGHRGLVGAALCRLLWAEGFGNLLTRTSQELDLRDQAATAAFFADTQPDYVFLAAAKVGGIAANVARPAEFLYDNLAIQNNVIHAAHITRVKKLLFLGSSCIYPKFAAQPIREEALLTGSLEPTNEWYALAKIAGIKLVQAYRQQDDFSGINIMPTNLYGNEDNFDLESSHVLPALLRKFHEAKETNAPEVEVWGTGTPRREFLHVDDLAAACLFLMRQYDSGEIINVGTGRDISIRDLAELIREIVDVDCAIRFAPDRPDGTPQKRLEVSRLTALGWSAKIRLRDGIAQTYEWYRQSLV